MFSQCPPLTILLLTLCFPPILAQQVCYYPDGTEATDHTPCNASASNTPTDASSCCHDTSNSYCQDNNLCTWNGAMYRGACTDKSWTSPSCPQQCTEGSVFRLPPLSSPNSLNSNSELTSPTKKSSTQHSHEHIPLPRLRRLGMRTHRLLLHQLHPPQLRHPPPRHPAPRRQKRRHRARRSQCPQHSRRYSHRKRRDRTNQRCLLLYADRLEVAKPLRRLGCGPRCGNTAWITLGSMFSAAVSAAEEVERREGGSAAVGRFIE